MLFLLQSKITDCGSCFGEISENAETKFFLSSNTHVDVTSIDVVSIRVCPQDYTSGVV
jgi:hypothetical protein